MGCIKISEEKLGRLQKEMIEKDTQRQGLNLEEEDEEEEALKAILTKYKHLFHTEGQKLTFTHRVKHSLKIKERMVTRYRKLNENMIEDKHPIPNISDILDKLGESQYFTSLDLASGYHEVEMDRKDAAKTAFSTDQDHFEYKRMPFGLKNVPAIFQRLMHTILKGRHSCT